MSTALAREQVVRFLSTADSEVLCLRGPWGSGKTFTWQKILEAEKANIKLPRYAYVSLFGVNDLDGLRKVIFENTVARENIGEGPSIATLAENIKKQAQPVIDAASKLPVVGDFVAAASALGPYLSLSISKQIICFDDMERVGANLEIREILGLISFLREQRGCKIAILANSDALRGTQLEQFEQYQEKVVDRSIAFDPTPTECADIALGVDHYGLREKCVALGITNIRVIKKIEYAAKQAHEILAKFDAEVRKQASHSLALLGWVEWSKDAPPFEFLADIKQRQIMSVVSDKADTDPRAASWNALLDSYRFDGVDAFDHVLREGLIKGYFDVAKMLDRGALAQDAFRAGDARAARAKAWSLLHDSFDQNGPEFVSALVLSVTSNIQFADPRSISEAVGILRECGEPQKATGIIAAYIEFHGANAAAFDVERFRGWDRPSDPEFIEALRGRFDELDDVKTPIDAILRRGSGRGRPGDLEIASRVTADDLYREFKSRRAEELHDLINGCLSSDRIVNADFRERTIANRAKEALLKIKAEGGMNELRVSRYGNLDSFVSGREEDRGKDY